jgi:sucrose-6-phosphate hydrolase SacC (GH32 family)
VKVRTAPNSATTPARDWHRPRFHFSAQKNWINDPNGLIWHDGEYHLFYQYNPFSEQWGHMSWGHAVSTDLIDWQELPVAIAEDERVSVYSGSVVADTYNSSGFGDGRTTPLVAIYTGCLRVSEGGQAQELAHSTDHGRSWTKYAGNPVLSAPVKDFRDPKVFWHAGTQRWVMVVVLPDARRAQFYGSADLKAWALMSEFEAPFEGQGIWECPDLLRLPLDDAEAAAAAEVGEEAPWLFKVDVFGGHPSGGTGARIFFGHFDGARFTAQPEAAPHWADQGADFYAALSWSGLPGADGAPPQRAVWLAWMNCHRYAKHTPTSPWRGAMSVPRELRVRRAANGSWRLLQAPVPELTRLRGPLHSLSAMTLAGAARDILPPGCDGLALDVELHITACNAAAAGLRLRVGEGVGVGVGGSLEEFTEVGYDSASGAVYVDRSRSGFQPPDDALYAQRHEIRVDAPSAEAPLRLRVLLDGCLLEVFIGDGEGTISEQIFPGAASTGLQLFARHGDASLASARIWPMRGTGRR